MKVVDSGREVVPRALLITVLLTAVLPVICPAKGKSPVSRRPKKLIATGWDMPDTRRLRQNLAEMERRPFDGVVLEVLGRKENKSTCRLRWAFADEKWQRKWFQPAIDDLRACKFKRLTDNFALFNANPGSVDWFDDAGWANIVDHWRIAAWVAKQSGLKGLLFDPEPYARDYKQFSYAAQPQHKKHTFDQYRRQARRRGREVMKAVAAEYPNITVFSYFMNSIHRWALSQAKPAAVLEKSAYGLLPAFIDGWFDAGASGVTLVDGCESAYRYNSDREYLEAAVLIKGDAQRLISPANRSRYRAQVQVSYGVYLDAYWNPKSSPWYIDGLGGPRVKRLQSNLAMAMKCSDEYVWVYGEKFRWWPTPNKGVKSKTWPEAMPGCEGVLRYVRDPADYGRRQMEKLKAAGKGANLARNGDFGSKTAKSDTGAAQVWKEGGCPAGWTRWQDKESKGTFTWDRNVGRSAKGSARAAKVRQGCFSQKYDVKPGQRYVVRAFRKIQGRGSAWMHIRWQTAEDKWTAQRQDKLIYADGPPGAWSELFAVVEVPKPAAKLIILLLAGDQPTADDIVWFDDVELYVRE